MKKYEIRLKQMKHRTSGLFKSGNVFPSFLTRTQYRSTESKNIYTQNTYKIDQQHV